MWGMTSFVQWKTLFRLMSCIAVPLLLCHFEEGLPRINAGVVDQNVDAPEAGHRILDHLCHSVAAAGIGLKAKCRAAFRLQSGCDLLDARPVKVGEKYMGPALGKQLCDPRANARGRPGHDDDFILDQFHQPLLRTRADGIKCPSTPLAQPRAEARQVALLQVIVDQEANPNRQRNQAGCAGG